MLFGGSRGFPVRKFELVLIIHAHQPVGNFDDVFERSYQQAYLPFVEVLQRHPAIRMGLHYSGPLLEWIERAHPEYFERLRGLVKKKQVEILGGGFYEPILAVIPPRDCHEQITRLADYVERHFGARPGGAWLAERVWEPQLPSSLARAGVEYTLVDDNHFQGAGFEIDQLYGYYLAEDLGHSVKVLPGLKTLRYLLPFRRPSETVEFLSGCAKQYPGGFAAMGDDLEKFGVWPGTNQLCYADGWLDQFFTALEQASDWLATSTPADAVASRPALGRADLPTASYTEMMEWSLPTEARFRYHELVEEFAKRPDALPFLRGGTWRGFFSKYSESNLLHKKMLYASNKVSQLDDSRRRDKIFSEAHEEARTSLLRGQCNDAYWHGVFGGLYSPHLRTAVWKALDAAETIAEGLGHRGRHYEDAQQLDFDADGREEMYFTSDRYAALVAPERGGVISALDFRPANATLINSLKRRPETYHMQLRNPPPKSPDHVQSIHDQTRTKEDGLERWLQYDRWPQESFRLLLFGMGKTLQDCSSVNLQEDATLAAGRYDVSDLSPSGVKLTSSVSPDWAVQKNLSFAPSAEGFDIACDLKVRRKAPGTASMNIGVEIILNFLAPSTPDRYFESGGNRFPLRWTAAVAASSLRVVDEWQRVAAAIDAPSAQSFWILPIETVSESEGGFERVYQGSQIVAVWPVELASGAEWKGRLVLRAAQLA
jgi:4-alpha-glucanotransferase